MPRQRSPPSPSLPPSPVRLRNASPCTHTHPPTVLIKRLSKPQTVLIKRLSMPQTVLIRRSVESLRAQTPPGLLLRPARPAHCGPPRRRPRLPPRQAGAAPLPVLTGQVSSLPRTKRTRHFHAPPHYPPPALRAARAAPLRPKLNPEPLLPPTPPPPFPTLPPTVPPTVASIAPAPLPSPPPAPSTHRPAAPTRARGAERGEPGPP